MHQHRPTIAQPALKAAMLSQHSADNLLGTELARPAICLDQAQGQLGRCGLGSVDFVDVGREAVQQLDGFRLEAGGMFADAISITSIAVRYAALYPAPRWEFMTL
ncbi:hypothetical protein J4732_15460 [Serratia marcescens]|uniref:Uncharacterized protein n=1 Tax=Serratia marcescens TaxID=615 RepID=A0A939SNW3_SERMA|nr:hypothetical protein [Serratia marcescens]